MPMLAVVFAATYFWAQVILLYLNSKIAAYGLALGLSSGSYFVYLFAISHLANRWLRTKQCEKCHEPLTSVGGGFVDGTEPSLRELSIYLFVVSLPLGSWIILGNGSLFSLHPS